MVTSRRGLKYRKVASVPFFIMRMKYLEARISMVQEMGQPEVDILRRESLVRVGSLVKTKRAVMCHVSPCDT